MNVIETMETEGRKALTWLQLAALRLVGESAKAGAYLGEMESEHKLVKVAIDAGIAEAEAHGLPVEAIEDAGAKVIAVAKEIAAELAPPTVAALPALPAPSTANPGGADAQG